MDKYKSACRMEKTRPTHADKQHLEIESIVEALKAQSGATTKTPQPTPEPESDLKGEEEKVKRVVGGVRGFERRTARMGRSRAK